jgi:hypothetical protein
MNIFISPLDLGLHHVYHSFEVYTNTCCIPAVVLRLCVYKCVVLDLTTSTGITKPCFCKGVWKHKHNLAKHKVVFNYQSISYPSTSYTINLL